MTTKRWYSPRDAIRAGFFPFGYAALMKKIKVGEVKALNISEGKKKPTYKILINDLEQFTPSQ